MPGPKCSVCDLDSSTVGALETVGATKEVNGKVVKVSLLACAYCKKHHLEVHDESALE